MDLKGWPAAVQESFMRQVLSSRHAESRDSGHARKHKVPPLGLAPSVGMTDLRLGLKSRNARRCAAYFSSLTTDFWLLLFNLLVFGFFFLFLEELLVVGEAVVQGVQGAAEDELVGFGVFLGGGG